MRLGRSSSRQWTLGVSQAEQVSWVYTWWTPEMNSASKGGQLTRNASKLSSAHCWWGTISALTKHGHDQVSAQAKHCWAQEIGFSAGGPGPGNYAPSTFVHGQVPGQLSHIPDVSGRNNGGPLNSYPPEGNPCQFERSIQT